MSDENDGFTVVVIDHDIRSNEKMVFCLKKNPSVSFVKCFHDADKALHFLTETPAESVFLSVRVLIDQGFDWLAYLLKMFNNFVAIVFILSPEHAELNKVIKASGFNFLQKPVDVFQLNNMINKIHDDRKTGLIEMSHNEMINKIH